MGTTNCSAQRTHWLKSFRIICYILLMLKSCVHVNTDHIIWKQKNNQQFNISVHQYSRNNHVFMGCICSGFASLPAELAPDDPPNKSAEPCDDPPDDPTEEFTIMLVTPATIDPTMLPMNPNRSDPPPLGFGCVSVAAASASASAEPALLIVVFEPAKKFCKNSFGCSGRSSSSGSCGFGGEKKTTHNCMSRAKCVLRVRDDTQTPHALDNICARSCCTNVPQSSRTEYVNERLFVELYVTEVAYNCCLLNNASCEHSRIWCLYTANITQHIYRIIERSVRNRWRH